MGNNPERKMSSCPNCGSAKALKLIEGGLNKCDDCGKTFKFEDGDWKEVKE